MRGVYVNGAADPTGIFAALIVFAVLAVICVAVVVWGSWR